MNESRRNLQSIMGIKRDSVYSLHSDNIETVRVWLTAHQILKSADEGGAQAALIQVFSIAQVNDFVNKL